MPPRARLLWPALTRAACPASSSCGARFPARLRNAAYLRRATTAASSGEQQPILRVTDLPAPHSGHIRVLELNRPAARNALSRALVAELRSQVDAVHAQYDPATGDEIAPASWNKRFGGMAGEDQKGPTRALIVASAVDSCFCAGADLKERKGFSQEETSAFLQTLRSTLSSLAALPIPTISAISSLALGGGLELALATHLRVLGSNAIVGLPETRLAILPGAGGTFRLPAIVGAARARDLILTGRRVAGPEAYFLGLADRLVEVQAADEAQAERWRGWMAEVDTAGGDGAADSAKAAAAAEAKKLLDGEVAARARPAVLVEAVRLAAEICEGGPVAVRAALQAVTAPSEDMEAQMYERVVATDDRNEALRAFAEKRRPVFTGR